MNKALLSLVLAGFAVVTALALWQHGYFDIFSAQLTSWAGIQVLLDLAISLLLVLVWITRDCKRRRISSWPWIVLTLVAGSFGPLLYLLLRPSEQS